jgi:hypothetical protein
MGIPERNYHRLHSILERWELSQEDIYYAIENGFLKVSVWMPLRVVERGVMHDGKLIYQQSHEHKEGFLGVRQEDFYRLTSTGRAKLRIFRSIKVEGNIIRMAYEPPQPALMVCIHDLVVLEKDRIAFEALYGLSLKAPGSCKTNCTLHSHSGFTASDDYHHITINGDEYHLGDVQASIVHQLHDAAETPNQWVHGKTLLDGANSRAIRLRDVFKSKSDWDKLIISNRRGYYRLNVPLPAIASVESKKSKAA